MKRPLVFVLIAIAIVGAVILFADEPLGLDQMRAKLAAFGVWQAERPLAAALIFFVAYVAVTALSLPFATG